MLQITQTSQFVVMREGQLDQEWLDAAVAMERRQAVQEAAGQAISATMQHGLALARNAGTALLERLEEAIESVG